MTERPVHDHAHDEHIAEAVASGRLAILETADRASGAPARTPVAFAERSDGSLVVAAHDATAPWATALRADPRCRHETRGLVLDDVARELTGAEREAAAAELADAYGPVAVPASAPMYELRPVALEDAGAR